MGLSVGEALLIKELIRFLIEEGVDIFVIQSALKKAMRLSNLSNDQIIEEITKAQDKVRDSGFPEEYD